MERCPVCRAHYKGNNTCYRCQADLENLLQIEAKAFAWERKAVQCIYKGDIVAAKEAVLYAQRLQYSPFNRLLLGFIEHLD